jgi:hypothetical protein
MKDSVLLNYWIDELVPWACWKSESLIYFPHNKCASTLYDLLFLKLNWKKTTTQDINWSSDTVISHIRSPIVKHYKGIVEGLLFFPEVFDFFKKISNIDSVKFLTCLTSIDPHSYTIYRYLGTNAINVHWIPLDTRIDHKKTLFEILETNNQPVPQDVQDWFNNLGVVNSATAEERWLYDRLIELPIQPEIKRYIDFDTCLYDRVTKSDHIEPKNYQLRILELKTHGYSQLEAESIADQEVFNGEYLLWKH